MNIDTYVETLFENKFPHIRICERHLDAFTWMEQLGFLNKFTFVHIQKVTHSDMKLPNFKKNFFKLCPFAVVLGWHARHMQCAVQKCYFSPFLRVKMGFSSKVG